GADLAPRRTRPPLPPTEHDGSGCSRVPADDTTRRTPGPARSQAHLTVGLGHPGDVGNVPARPRTRILSGALGVCDRAGRARGQAPATGGPTARHALPRVGCGALDPLVTPVTDRGPVHPPCLAGSTSSAHG